jgi:Tfp pilus assembly protein PilX
MNILYIGRNVAHRRQKGMVLIIALLVLVAMTLASIGLMRSVDTSTLAIANLVLRQTADEAAFVAIEREIRRIEALAQTNIDQFDNNFALGYYAAIQAGENTKGIPVLLQNRQDAGVTRHQVDSLGNAARVMVERLCTQAGPFDSSRCVFGGLASSASSVGDTVNANEQPGAITTVGTTPLALYRITARIDGPRNVVSYAQSIITLR